MHISVSEDIIIISKELHLNNKTCPPTQRPKSLLEVKKKKKKDSNFNKSKTAVKT